MRHERAPRLTAEALGAADLKESSMHWKPPPGEACDARLDPFRDRAGLVLEDGGVEYARVYLEAETYFEQVKGHLWWRTWSAPCEVIHGYMLLADGQFTDWVSRRAELEQDIDDWLSGCFQYVGVKYHVVWLSTEESRRVRDEIFEDDPSPD